MVKLSALRFNCVTHNFITLPLAFPYSRFPTPYSPFMDTQEPNFLAENQSVAKLIAQLHSYFKNSYSRSKMQRSSLISHLETAEGDRVLELQHQIRDMDAELAVMGILSDALSIADRLLHLRSVQKELGTESGTYLERKKEKGER